MLKNKSLGGEIVWWHWEVFQCKNKILFCKMETDKVLPNLLFNKEQTSILGVGVSILAYCLTLLSWENTFFHSGTLHNAAARAFFLLKSYVLCRHFLSKRCFTYGWIYWRVLRSHLVWTGTRVSGWFCWMVWQQHEMHINQVDSANIDTSSCLKQSFSRGTLGSWDWSCPKSPLTQLIT